MSANKKLFVFYTTRPFIFVNLSFQKNVKMLVKENVIEILKDVIYFPKGDNIIALNMVENMHVKEMSKRKIQ